MLFRLLPAFVVRRLARLRYPRLLLLTGALFVIDLLVPDLLPLADEILLGLATALLWSRKRRQEELVPRPDASPDELENGRQ